MAKVYFKAGNTDALISVTMQVKTEKKEGSNAHHVVFTDEGKEFADHTTRVDSVAFLIPEYSPEGYDTNRVTQFFLSADVILGLAEKIKSMSGKVLNLKYQEPDDDLPF